MYGLVLEGGGGKGSFQIGACKALTELGVEISVIAGTSVGAINGAMVVQGDVDKAYEMWYNIDPYSVISITDLGLEDNETKELKAENFVYYIKRLKKIITEKGLDVEPLIKIIRSAVDEDKIRKSPIDFGMVTIDLTGRKAVEIYKNDIPYGKIADYIIASASFPAFRRAVIDGKVFIDGGFYNALPINMVSNKGCKDIIVLRTYSIGVKKHVNKTGLNIINISPTESLGPMLDFSTERARLNLKMGYFDTMKVFKKLKGLNYYITPLNNDKFFIDYVMSLKEDKINKLCEMFGMEKNSGRRAVFEYIIPKVADLLGLSAKNSYEDVAYSLLEKVAEKQNIEKFKIYSSDELFSEVRGKYNLNNDEFIKQIPSFLKNRELLTKLLKDRILAGVADELFGE